jgi:triosephosphate isomerase
MRTKIAAANWKMNLTFQQGKELIDRILTTAPDPGPGNKVVFAVPFPYLRMVGKKVKGLDQFHVAAQNIHHKKSGAYTGEVSAEMVKSMGTEYVVIGHSERREYFHETHEMLALKVDLALEQGLVPLFCCGEPLEIREAGKQDEYVRKQLEESLFHLNALDLLKMVIAYEPIWAIGTGKTATSQQAQDMHKGLRAVLASKYGKEVADSIPILYGGSVKASNAVELFTQPDVDGGLVGGASLNADEFVAIIHALHS